MKLNTKNPLRTLLQSVDLLFEKVPIKKIDEIPEYEPEMVGQIWDISEQTKINYRKIIYDYKKEITNLPAYKICKSWIKREIKKNHRYAEQIIKISIDRFTEKVILDFLTEYLVNRTIEKHTDNTYSLLEDTKKESREISLKKIKNYLKNEVFSDYCFITLRNFECKPELLKTITFEDGSNLKLISPREFSVIADVDHGVIRPNFTKLKYIISIHIKKPQYNANKILRNLDKFQFALKILNEGDVQFGGIYSSESENWEQKHISELRAEPVLDTPKKKYVLGKEKLKELKKFYDKFSVMNLTKGNFTFLNRSIERFSKARDKDIVHDMLVDYITSLESLYSSNEQNLSYRMSLRVALLLGKTAKEKKLIQEFILQIYNLRSKIVHGEPLPPVEIDEKEIPIEECTKKLEIITRNSIKIFLELINKFPEKDEIHKEIDNSIFDASMQKKFSKFQKISIDL
tara:strand:+ start:2832 stop:4208 length:1377 start_codon:yes stop_codon:yes gene_type:complete